MKVLIVASYNYGKYSPFVSEQAESVQGLNIQIDYFPVKGKGVFGYLKNRKELLKKIEKYPVSKGLKRKLRESLDKVSTE